MSARIRRFTVLHSLSNIKPTLKGLPIIMARRKTAASQPMSTESFEDSLAELQTIVTELEDGSLPLETSLGRFERGVALLRQCYQRLDSIQQRIEIFMKEPTTQAHVSTPSGEFQSIDGNAPLDVQAQSNRSPESEFELLQPESGFESNTEPKTGLF